MTYLGMPSAPPEYREIFKKMFDFEQRKKSKAITFL